MLLLKINQPFVHLTSRPFFLHCFHNFCSLTLSLSTGMNGKSILSAMGRHTPEHSSVMSTAGSGATTSPCSSRSSSQHSGTGAHTPGGPHRSPCAHVKISEGSGNALIPNAGPARLPVSPKHSPGEVSFAETRSSSAGSLWPSLTAEMTCETDRWPIYCTCSFSGCFSESRKDPQMVEFKGFYVIECLPKLTLGFRGKTRPFALLTGVKASDTWIAINCNYLYLMFADRLRNFERHD